MSMCVGGVKKVAKITMDWKKEDKLLTKQRKDFEALKERTRQQQVYEIPVTFKKTLKKATDKRFAKPVVIAKKDLRIFKPYIKKDDKNYATINLREIAQAVIKDNGR